MRRGWAAWVVVAMLSGCTSYQQSKRVARGGGITAGVGLAVAIIAYVAFSKTAGNASFSCGESIVCPISVGAGLAGILAVPVGLVIAAGGLIGMADDYPEPGEARRVSAPPPAAVANGFWCQRDTGTCTNEPASCGLDCLSASSIWCAPYQTVDGEPGNLCGLSAEVCVVLANSDHNRRGRENFGECAQRTEPFPAARNEKSPIP